MMTGHSFEIAGRNVHIWTLRVEASDSVAANLESVLTPEEKERAARFRFESLRRSFVVTRGVLRCLLGRYSDVHPSRIRFNYGLKGKPALAPATGIEFNTTHSDGVAVFGFTLGCPIGLDLERIRPLSDIQQIAEHFFCSEEAAEIMSSRPDERERAFFHCWTRKEAYIKATGDGLSVPLDSFRVTLQPDEPAGFIHLGHDRNAANAWRLHDLCLVSGYAAALAYYGGHRSLSVFPILDAGEFSSML